MSVFIHFSFSVYWFLYLFVKFPFAKRLFSDKWRFVALLASGFVLKFAGNALFDVIEGGLGDGFIAQRVGSYLSGGAYFNRGFLEDITSNSRLFYSLFDSMLFVEIPFLLFGWEDIGRKQRGGGHLLAVLICFGVFMSSNVTMLNRITSLSAPLFAVLFGELLTMKGCHANKLMRNGFLLFCLIVCFLPVARMRKAWIRSNVKEILYTPSVFCLMNHYDEDWVADNIEERALIE